MRLRHEPVTSMLESARSRGGRKTRLHAPHGYTHEEAPVRRIAAVAAGREGLVKTHPNGGGLDGVTGETSLHRAGKRPTPAAGVGRTQTTVTSPGRPRQPYADRGRLLFQSLPQERLGRRRGERLYHRRQEPREMKSPWPRPLRQVRPARLEEQANGPSRRTRPYASVE